MMSASSPGIRNPSPIGFKTDEILRIITINENRDAVLQHEVDRR